MQENLKTIFPEFPTINLELAIENLDLVRQISQNYNQNLAKAKKNNRKNTKKLAIPSLIDTFEISLKFDVKANSSYRNIKKRLKKMSFFAPTNYILQGQIALEIMQKLDQSKFKIIYQDRIIT